MIREEVFFVDVETGDYGTLRNRPDIKIITSKTFRTSFEFDGDFYRQNLYPANKRYPGKYVRVCLVATKDGDPICLKNRDEFEEIARRPTSSAEIIARFSALIGGIKL